MRKPTLDINDLIDRDDPGIVVLRDWAAQPNANASRFLPRDVDLAHRTLLHLRITTRSLLGAIVFETGGVGVADDLIRLWGSGTQRSLLLANHGASTVKGRPLDDIVFVADDAHGGLFALDGRASAEHQAGDVQYLAADDTEWTSLEVGYSDFVCWCLTGDLGLLYGAESFAAKMASHAHPAFNEVLSAYPFPWTEEGRAAGASIRTIDADEHLRLRLELLGLPGDAGTS